MATRTVNDRRRYIQQLSKRTPTFSLLANESNFNISLRPVLPPPPSPSSGPSTIQPTYTIIKHTEDLPKTRIAIVRRTSTTKNEKGETIEINESALSKPVELPPMYTNGGASVYVIRRPIPPPEPPRQTQVFKSADDLQQTSTPIMIETATATTNNIQYTRTPTSTKENITSPSQLHSPTNTDTESPTIHSSVNNHSESPKHLLSSPTQSSTTQQTARRSKSKSRTQKSVRSNSKSRSRRVRRRRPKRHSPPSSSFIQEKSKDTDQKLNSFSSARTKSTVVQSNLPPPVTVKNGTVQNIPPPIIRNVTFVENSYGKGETSKPTIKRSISKKKTRFQNEIDNELTEKLIETSQLHACFVYLSRHIRLVIILCFIVVLLALADVCVSAYFLAVNSKTYLPSKIAGIVIGSVLTIAALCLLYCVLAYIGARGGYFPYNDNGPHVGGRVFALISPSHPNAHLYIPRNYRRMSKNNRTLSSISISTISTIQPRTINRQKTIITEINGTKNTKNITIEMPERLLTGRKMSPRSHKRKLNKVINNIGHVVEVTKKRYNDDIPNRVVVKAEDNIKATV